MIPFKTIEDLIKKHLSLEKDLSTTIQETTQLDKQKSQQLSLDSNKKKETSLTIALQKNIRTQKY